MSKLTGKCFASQSLGTLDSKCTIVPVVSKGIKTVTGDTKSIQMVKRVIINRDTIGTNLVGIDKGVLKAVSKP